MGNKTVLWDQEGSVLMKVLLDEDVYSAVMEEVYSVRSFAVSHPFVSRSGIQAPLPLQTPDLLSRLRKRSGWNAGAVFHLAWLVRACCDFRADCGLRPRSMGAPFQLVAGCCRPCTSAVRARDCCTSGSVLWHGCHQGK